MRVSWELWSIVTKVSAIIRTFNCFPIYKVLVTNFSATKLKVAIYVNDNMYLRIYLWYKYPGLGLYLFLQLVPVGRASVLDCRWNALIQRAFEEELSSRQTFVKSPELLHHLLWLSVIFLYPPYKQYCVWILFPSYLVISSNYQTCLGLLMHYPLIGDIHSLILKALFLRDPKVSFSWGNVYV